ncbi:MAG: c-type cytochrome domain-containing protein [Ignavibacteriaceae bacterium]|jgi:hypothetical protein|nr:c-type cytochrome domain-containing protein [Ignavibacteriaceae bacterium]
MNILNTTNILRFLTLIISSIIFISCDDTLTVEDVDSYPMPQSNISFAKNIYPILQVKCAFSGCHAQPDPSKGLDLSTYAGVTADPTIVFPREPDLSKLVWAIEARPPFPPMPPVGYARPLTDEQIRGIKKWIEEGAQNN